LTFFGLEWLLLRSGQRCTTLRRLMVHEKIYDEFVPKLVKAYGSVKVGDPLAADTLCGPLHNPRAVENYERTIAHIKTLKSAKVWSFAVCGEPGL
jgi:acyl-CoA reductase-like NAD-dependent aldehyde dehydrogenase